MSDNLNDKKYKAIDPDSIIELKFNGRFFSDIRAVFMYYLTKDRSKDAIGKTMETILKGEINSEEEYPLYVLLQLVIYLEAEAKKQGYVVETSLPTFTDEGFPENPHSENGPSE
jgi:hypothetical protein